MYDPDEIITIENWKEYSENSPNNRFLEYIKAQQDILPFLGKILKANNFEEMKKELSNFYNERTEFIKHANNNFPS